MIAPLLGAVAGSVIGRKLGRAHGQRVADRLAWQIAEQLAPAQQRRQAEPPRWSRFVGHPDGTVEEVTKR